MYMLRSWIRHFFLAQTGAALICSYNCYYVPMFKVLNFYCYENFFVNWWNTSLKSNVTELYQYRYVRMGRKMIFLAVGSSGNTRYKVERTYLNTDDTCPKFLNPVLWSRLGFPSALGFWLFLSHLFAPKTSSKHWWYYFLLFTPLVWGLLRISIVLNFFWGGVTVAFKYRSGST